MSAGLGTAWGHTIDWKVACTRDVRGNQTGKTAIQEAHRPDRIDIHCLSYRNQCARCVGEAM